MGPSIKDARTFSVIFDPPPPRLHLNDPLPLSVWTQILKQ